ncbi:hypothetical protein ACYSNU_02250 [Enterococcus sp. LJL120]
MDRKLLLKLAAGAGTLVGAGLLLATLFSYLEYYRYGFFIDMEDRLELFLPAILGIILIAFALSLPALFKKWANTNPEDKHWKDF